MTERSLKNITASVRQKLLNLARSKREDHQLVMVRYALERFLYRLSQSRYKDRFILKGAMLFSIWSDVPYRSTRDLDLLGYGTNDIKELESIFREILQVEVEDDGLVFDADTIHAEMIKVEDEYQGVRIKFLGRMERSRVPMQVDIGFGDSVVPMPELTEYPVMLDFSAPRIRAYRRETAIAEKYHAMATKELANSRMKDFFDIGVLSRDFEYEGELLREAISATFNRRDTVIPTVELKSWTEQFYNNQSKQAQWRAFISRSKIEEDLSLEEIIKIVRGFLMEPSKAASEDRAFKKKWIPPGPWQ